MTRVVRMLHLRRLREQPLRTGLAVVAIAAGVSLSVAVGVASTSVRGSLGRFGRSVAGAAPLRVMGPVSHGGLDEGVAARLARVRGVAAAVPVVQTVAVVVDRTGATIPVLAIGVDCSVQELFGNIGCDPDAVRTAADDSPPFVSGVLAQRLGTTGYIRTDVGIIPLRGAPTLPRLEQVNRGRVVVFPLPQAQRVFARPHRVDAVYVKPVDDTASVGLRRRLVDAAGPQNTVSSTTEPLPGTTSGGVVLPLLAMLGLVTLSVGALLVFNITRLSLAERRRSLAIAAAIGVPARLAAAGLLAEAGVVGLVGGLLGTALGTVIARPMVAAMSRDLEQSIGAVLHVHAGPLVLASGVVGGVALALAAAWLPARTGARVDIVSELHHGSAGEPDVAGASTSARLMWSALAVLAVVAGGLVRRNEGISGWTPMVAYGSVLVGSTALFVGVAAWSPVVIGAGARLVGRFSARRPSARLAATTIERVPRQTGAMVTALAAAVALAAGLGNFLPANRDGVSSAYGSLAGGRLFVTTLALNNTIAIDSKASPTVLDAVARVPGVASVDRSYFVAVDHAGARFNVSAYERLDRGFRSLRGDAPSAVLASGRALVAPGLARRSRLHPGSVLAIPTPAGNRRVVVGGIWANPSDEGRTVTVTPAVFAGLFGTQPAIGAYVRTAPGADPADVAARIRAARIDPGLRVYTTPAYTRRLADEVAHYLQPFWILQRLLLVVAFIATSASLLLVGVQRRREQGVLAAVGLGPIGMRRMILVEGGLIGTVGAGLGVAAGMVITVLLTQVSGVLFGLDPPLRLEVVPAAGYAMVGVAVVVLAALWPAQQVARVPVVEVLRYE